MDGRKTLLDCIMWWTCVCKFTLKILYINQHMTCSTLTHFEKKKLISFNRCYNETRDPWPYFYPSNSSLVSFCSFFIFSYKNIDSILFRSTLILHIFLNMLSIKDCTFSSKVFWWKSHGLIRNFLKFIFPC